MKIDILSVLSQKSPKSSAKKAVSEQTQIIFAQIVKKWANILRRDGFRESSTPENAEINLESSFIFRKM